MKKEYDFSKGVRGKFYKSNVKLNIPVYLDADNRKFIEDIAKRKKKDLNTVVNALLRNDKKIAEVLS